MDQGYFSHSHKYGITSAKRQIAVKYGALRHFPFRMISFS